MTRPVAASALSLSIASLALLSACSSVAPPRLSIADVQVREVTPEGSSMVVFVRAENPNDKPIPLRSLDYSVSMGGQHVFAATREAEATLPRFGTLDLPLPVSVPATDRPIGPSDFDLSLTLRYRAPGKLNETLFDAGLLRPSVSAGGEGSADLTGG
ncbi:MAG: LEA type 2 family protein [Phycisphaerales bacterium]